jgi:hypothetical protein
MSWRLVRDKHSGLICRGIMTKEKTFFVHRPQEIDIYENTVKIVKNLDQELTIEGFGYDEEKHCFIIFLAERLKQGDNLTLSMDFLAQLNDDLSGTKDIKHFLAQ